MPSGRESVLWDVWQWSHAIGYSAFAGEPCASDGGRMPVLLKSISKGGAK